MTQSEVEKLANKVKKLSRDCKVLEEKAKKVAICIYIYIYI